MFLSKIVEESAQRFGSLPCCVIQMLMNDEGNNAYSGTREQRNKSNSAIGMKFLSYHEAWNVLQQHEKWLQRQIMMAFLVSRQQNHHQQQDEGNECVTVVAYLSSNSIDMLLSILACVSTKTANQKSHNKNNNNHVTTTRTEEFVTTTTTIPALLNARWTPSEMASALQSHSKSSDKNGNRLRSRTILLYGEGFESTAQQVQKILHHHHHNVHILPIPQFSNRGMKHIMSSNSDDNFNNDNKRFHDEHEKEESDGTLNHRIDSLISQVMEEETTSSVDDNHEEDAIILFTSGTTSGGSKGVRLSHKALYVQALAKLRSPCRYSNRTKMLASTVPIFHVGGLNSTLALLLAGGSWVFPPSSLPGQGQKIRSVGFDPANVLQSLSHPQIQTNTLVVVPAMIQALLKEIISPSNSFPNEKHQMKKRRTYPSVELILIGGQSINTKTVSHLQSIFPRSRLVQTYACTEAASSMTFHDILKASSLEKKNKNAHTHHGSSNNNDNNRIKKYVHDNHYASNNNHGSAATQNNQIGNVGYCVGIPPPHVKLGLLENKSADVEEQEPKASNNRSATASNNIGRPASSTTGRSWIHTPYQVGIIATKGPHVMNGYWSRDVPIKDRITHHPCITKKNQLKPNHDDDDWFVTNDLGFFDKYGQLYFTGRVRDVIRTGGETVVATEVEEVLLRHPFIEDCAVFALDDEKFGQTVCAALVMKRERQESVTTTNGTTSSSSSMLSLANLRLFCANQNLAGYKRPRRIFWLAENEMPRNSSGKVLKHRLVEHFRTDPPLLHSKL